jgi:hypothetical protein
MYTIHIHVYIYIYTCLFYTYNHSILIVTCYLAARETSHALGMIDADMGTRQAVRSNKQQTTTKAHAGPD